MPSILFNINKAQEKEIFELMALEGFTSKTAFFRFLIKFYKYQNAPDMRKLEKATIALEKIARKLSPEPELSAHEMAVQKTMEEMGL